MRTALIAFVALTFVTLGQQGLNGCGYGLFDPDIEQYCTGDANQTAAALVRLEKKGLRALRAIEFYTNRCDRDHKSYTQYLDRLQTDPLLLQGKHADYFRKMDDETRAREIKRSTDFLQWNVNRMQRIEFLRQHIRGLGFAGQSHQFGKTNLG